jgi:diketogulonate reductase-like aldo/keto reductase
VLWLVGLKISKHSIFMQHQQLYTTLNNGIKMPMLGLGVYDMYASEAESAILCALETGYRLIDTAAMYNNETEVGRAVKASGIAREEIFITTKFQHLEPDYDRTMRAFEESHRKLDCGTIDLYLIHWPIKRSRKSMWLALEQLYREGSVRAIGVANYLNPFLDELESYRTLVPTVNQVEFSPYLFLKDLLVRCQQDGIQLQAYTPLVRGQRMNDARLSSVAQRYGKTPAQIILRWALQNGVSTIPKSANPVRIRENFEVFGFQISEADMAVLNSLNENLRVVDDPMTML